MLALLVYPPSADLSIIACKENFKNVEREVRNAISRVNAVRSCSVCLGIRWQILKKKLNFWTTNESKVKILGKSFYSPSLKFVAGLDIP